MLELQAQGWGSAQSPAHQRSGPGAHWDQGQLSHQLFSAAMRDKGGVSDNPRLPFCAGGVIAVCWEEGLDLGLGTKGAPCLSFPISPAVMCIVS